MAQRLPTVRIVSDESPTGYVVINASEFDPSMHEKHASDPGEAGELDPTPVTAQARVVAASEAVAASTRIPTIRIVSDDHEGGFLTINRSDFDEKVDTEFVDASDGVDEPNLPGAPQDLAALSFAELRAEAKRLGLKASGTRADLQSAILEHLTAPAPSGAPASAS